MLFRSIESAFVDDGFFANLKRNIRNLTTFKQASKLSNIITDIKNLSVEKIAQGDTRGVTFDARSFDVLKSVVSSKVLNAVNVEAKFKELVSHLESVEGNSEVSGVINSVLSNNKKLVSRTTATKVGEASFLAGFAGTSFLTWILKDCADGLSLINAIKVLTTTSKTLTAVSVMTGLAIITWIITLFLAFKNVFKFLKGKKTQNSLTEAESAAVDSVSKSCSICVDIAKTLIGVKLDSTNIEKELENTAKRNK